MGFGRKDKNAFSVHRSEEVMPSTLRHLVRQSSSLSSNEGLGGEEGDVGRGTERSSSSGQARAMILSASLGSSNSSSVAGQTTSSGKGGGGGSSKGSNSNSRKTSPSPRRGLMSGAPSVESDGDGSRDKDG